jgi:hypothetical protein
MGIEWNNGITEVDGFQGKRMLGVERCISGCIDRKNRIWVWTDQECYVTTDEARAIAARLIEFADEIDGNTK